MRIALLSCHEFRYNTAYGAAGAGGGAGLGGAVYMHSGAAFILRCTLSGNSATGGAGGVDSTGFANGQSGQSLGGAIFNEGSLNVTASTIDTNISSGGGGGIYSLTGSVFLTQCTLPGNRSLSDRGGAVAARNALNVNQCTISGNTANIDSGGIRQDVGTLTLQNSIVAGNAVSSGAGAKDIYIGSSLTRVGANLIQSFGSDGAATLSGPASSTANPLLAPLDDYGGSTRTMALKPGSPARNAAVGSAVTSDQRGFSIVGNPDVGAYETGTVANYNAFVWEQLPAAATVAQHAAGIDFDGDGITNGSEYLALTDPADPGSYLRFTQVLRSGGNLNYSFATNPGGLYSLEYTPIDLQLSKDGRWEG